MHVVPAQRTHVPEQRQRRRRRSPSQINTYITCHRLWAFKYLWNLYEPTTPQQQFGIDGHKGVENWLTCGTPPLVDTKVGNAVAHIIQHLPPPSPYLEIEKPVEFDWGEVRYHGIPDVRYWSEHGRNICDHKFTSSVDWAMSEDDLRLDVQANVYAKHEFLVFPIEHIDLHWNYTERHSARVKPVNVRLQRTENEAHFESIHELTLEIEHAERTCTNPLDLPPNFASCHKYNKPCPHQQRCGLSAETMLVAIMTQEERKVDIRERMTNRRAGLSEGGGTAPPPGNPQPPPAAAQTPAPQAQAPAPQGYVAQPPTQYPGWAWNGQEWVSDASTAPVGSVWDGRQWVPQVPANASAAAPEAPAVPAVPAQVPVAAPVSEAPAQSQTHAQSTPNMNPPEAAEPGPPLETGKRGRPKGSKGKKAETELFQSHRLVFHASALIGGRTPEEAEAAYQAFVELENKA